MTVRNNTKDKGNNKGKAGTLEQLSFEAIIISFYFWQAFKTFVAGFEKTLQPWDINPSQCMALWFLRHYDTPLTASRIAWLLALETHSVTSLLDGLQKRALIKRRRSKTDRRVIEVVLTEEGKKLLVEIRHPYLKFLNSMFKGDLSEEEINTFINVLQHIWDTGFALQGIDPGKAHLVADRYAARIQTAIDALEKSQVNPGDRS
jgi:DNA-binding MarR family transcriptional regulator